MAHFTELIDQLPTSMMLVSDALRVTCAKEGTGTEEERRAEWLPLFLTPDATNGDMHPHVFVREGEDPAEIVERNIASTTPAQWQILAARAGRVRSPLLGGLYLDFLWRHRKRHRLPRPQEFARAAMGKYAVAVRERLGDGELFWDALLACRQLGRLAREMSDLTQAVTAARLLGELVDAVEAQWSSAPGWPLSGAQAMVWLVGLLRVHERSTDLLAQVDAMLRRLERFMPTGSPLERTYIGRDVFDRRTELEALLGLDTRRARSLLKAESLFAEAEARNSAGDHLIAGITMTDAVEMLTSLGEKTPAADAKRRAREFFMAAQTQMKPVVTTVSVPTAPLRAWVAQVAGQATLRAVLATAVGDSNVIPRWDEAQDAAAKSAGTYVLAAMASTTLLVDSRPVSRESDGKSAMLRHEWQLRLKWGVRMHWSPLLEKLKEDARLSPEAVLAELAEADAIPPHNRQALMYAVKAAIGGDHFAACHMLPLLLESTLRHVFARSGIDTSAFRLQEGGQIQERTMGVLFDSDRDSELVRRAIVVLGEDLWNWYRTVLFDEKGQNLRNRAAHGLLRDDECNSETIATLMLGLAALLRLPSTTSSRSPVGP